MIIEKDINGQPIVPDFVLSNRGDHKIGIIENVQNVKHNVELANPDEFTFNVYKQVDGKECSVWDQITDFKLVYVPQYDDWFEIEIGVDEEYATTMSVDALHLQEKQLSQLMLFSTEINSEKDVDREDYQITKFHDDTNPKKSLLRRVLADKAAHYSIYHVDESLMNITRVYSFDKKSIYDSLQEVAKDIGILFKFGEHDEANNGKINRTISAYDLYDYCEDCGEREEYMGDTCPKCGGKHITRGYGKDTNLFVSNDNLGDGIQYKQNKDNVKTCFKLTAGDDDLTAAVMNCNPNGSQYIWYFSDEMKNDMSPELRNKLAEYDSLYQSYYDQTEISGISAAMINTYNNLYDKYSPMTTDLFRIEYPITGYSTMMRDYYYAMRMDALLETTLAPAAKDTTIYTAEGQLVNIISSGITPIGFSDLSYITSTGAENAITKYAKCFYRSNLYRLTLKDGSLNKDTNTWTGKIFLESYTDSEDRATSDTLAIVFEQNTTDFIKREIEALQNNNEASKLGAANLFKLDQQEFKSSLSQYSLDNLNILLSVDDAVQDIVVKTQVPETETDVWTLYARYLNRRKVILQEIALRERQIATLRAKRDENNQIINGVEKGLLDVLDDVRGGINESLDIKDYLGDELWTQLASWRRESEYSQAAFISTDLNDSELMDRAMKFLEYAKKQIVKSATLQHSVTGELKNFLLLSDYKDMEHNFDVGNWIHLMVDNRLFKLRLTELKIDYGSLTKIAVTFSDVIQGQGTMSDIKSIFEKAKSMGSSYDATQHKADKGYSTTKKFDSFMDGSFNLTNNEIVSASGSEEMKMTDHGMLFRSYDDISQTYSSNQTKIVGNGIYFTDDAWETIKTGLGHFKYIDPETGEEKDGYGVIANDVVGNLMLGEDLKIFNETGSFIADGNGVTITAMPDSPAENVFRVRRKNADGSYTDYVYINKDGEMVLQASSIQMVTGEDLPSYIELTMDKAALKAGALNIILSNEFASVVDGNYTDANTTVMLMRGAKNITDDASVTYSVVAPNNLTGWWDEATHSYTVTDMVGDTATVSISATFEDVTVSKDFVIKRIKNGTDPISVRVDSSNGNIFKNTNVNTVLTCRVIRGNEDITDTISSFIWRKRGSDGNIIDEWTHVSGSSIMITPSDIDSKATFECEVSLNE